MANYSSEGIYIKKEVNKRLALITDEIIRRFNPESIILTGSFGRDEGAVSVKNGNISFLSDFEIIIVTYKYIHQNTLRELSSELRRKTDIKIGLWWNSPIKFASCLVANPTIANYDLKYGSKVLYGKDYLSIIPDFKPEDIPLDEGLRLLFNRMIESMKDFSISYLYSSPSSEEELNLLYSISKLILACQDALLLSLKKYSSSYRTRNDMFKYLFPKHFQKISDLHDLPVLASEATSYKLNPKTSFYSKNYKQLWFDTIRLCDATFRYIVKKNMNITFNSYSEFQERYLKCPNFAKKCYQKILILPIYQNLKSMAYVWFRTRRIMPLEMLKKIGTPWTRIIYSAIPCLYFSFLNELEIDESQLGQVRKTLSLFTELKSRNHNAFNEWEYLKNESYNLWRIICTDL